MFVFICFYYNRIICNNINTLEFDSSNFEFLSEFLIVVRSWDFILQVFIYVIFVFHVFLKINSNKFQLLS